MTDLAKMPAKELAELYARKREVWRQVVYAMLYAGRGHENGEQIGNKAKAGGDPLAERYVMVDDDLCQVANECDWRLFKHGSLEPIKERS